MANDEWTGLIPDNIPKEMDSFTAEIYDAVNDYSRELGNFNNAMYDSWKSETALNFNTSIDYLYNLIDGILSAKDSINKAILSSAKVMAERNEVDFPYELVTPTKNTHDGKKHLISLGPGSGGMVKPRVRKALETFLDACNKLKNSLENIKPKFSLFDPDGTLEAKCNELINKYVEKINAAIDGLSKSISTYLETEIEVVTLAEAQAADALA